MFLCDRTPSRLCIKMFTHILSILRNVTLDQHSTTYCAGYVPIASAFDIQAAQLTYALAPFMSDYGKNSAFLSLKSLRQVNVIGLTLPTWVLDKVLLYVKGIMRYYKVRFLRMYCGDKGEIVSVLPASMQSMQPTISKPVVLYFAVASDAI